MGDRPIRQDAHTLIDTALAAVDPEPTVHGSIALKGDFLRIDNQTYHLDHYERMVVLGFGKASLPMARAMESILQDHLTSGYVVTKTGHRKAPLPIKIIVEEAAHPLPDSHSLRSSQRIIKQLSSLGSNDIVFILISGGGSSLLTLPVPTVSLHELMELNAILLRSGVPIHKINVIRKHLSQIKGGQLVRHASPATVIALILSDVVGDPVDVIASGPTAPDPSTFQDALEVIREYQLEASIPKSTLSYLQEGIQGRHPETPKPGDEQFKKVQNVIIGSNIIAAEAVKDAAQNQGYHSEVLTTSLEGEARDVGKKCARLLREASHPSCLILGGETTVTIRGSGKGGRNQELALSAALELQGLSNVLCIALATDGTDGPTDAAGAIVDGDTVQKGEALGLEAAAYLKNNDSYNYLKRVGDLLVLGPTGTNVNDLIILLAG